nr:polyprenyl synthetase family protein [Kibdelosporangium sp. MJ126-NF4]CEL18601.1 Octaprenyl diphosphate synthase / Dimethylallyltransferase / (2E,6E)-farnesyl diphosphate synthase / Geranylgeranyl pyrophosphate synthetase [Kibdelosporangium sp. MJ126-NF4]CTQ98086.1 Octaprenyl diphosphate synthase (EC 2.5.1.90) / Dimethylallyltransferase (EC 2.5.1.1) / (2E,6E)-farnesyl diphosphate synthase (EC 2.5.1.10) / Geranylgeranyl pyrophosphate synthetase (EC 2.5.1.29) [Kibdelosporangium sp. MJ126-NF4]
MLEAQAVRPARFGLMAAIETRLNSFLAAERERWAAVDHRCAVPPDAVAGLVAAGGKRWRPAFCVSGFLAAGGPEAQTETLLDAAAAIELVHAAALIHDDVLDDSALRRGAPTVHTTHTAAHAAAGWLGESRRYGEGTAILAGDLAMVYAGQLTAGLPDVARPVWDEMLTEIQIGQYLDMAVAAEGVVDPDVSRWVAVCKSGRYSIHRPLLLGAAIAGRPQLATHFAEYGEALGEAFQLRDDLIDTFGDSAATGKPVGSDLAQHKMTLLLAMACGRDEQVRALVAEQEWDTEAIRRRLVETRAREEIEHRIDELVRWARAAIAQAGLDPAWQAELTDMAAQVAYRNR